VRAISDALQLDRRHVVISDQCLLACASHFVPRAASASACDDAILGLHRAYMPKQFGAFSTPAKLHEPFKGIVEKIIEDEIRLQAEAQLDPTFIGEVTKPLSPCSSIDTPPNTP
jgi:hypothetical protein